MTTSIIHLSDLHIHTSMEHLDNINCSKIVDNIVARYASDKPIILITGDIVDDGYEVQYQNAVRLLTPLVRSGFKVLAAPGNHDYGPKGNLYTEESQALFQKYILGELLSHQAALEPGQTMETLYPLKHETQDSIFIGVDSVVGAEDQFLHFASGKVGHEQRQSIIDILQSDEITGKNVIVYFHHHIFDRRSVMKMADADKVLSILAGNVHFVCFGHDHESEVFNNRYSIEWMLASGKSTEFLGDYMLQYREITIDNTGNSVALRSFPSQHG